MTTTSKQPGMNLQSDQAKAMVEDIKADNAALREADATAEAQAEVVVEQAQELAEAVEEALEELKEMKSDHG